MRKKWKFGDSIHTKEKLSSHLNEIILSIKTSEEDIVKKYWNTFLSYGELACSPFTDDWKSLKLENEENSYCYKGLLILETMIERIYKKPLTEVQFEVFHTYEGLIYLSTRVDLIKKLGSDENNKYRNLHFFIDAFNHLSNNVDLDELLEKDFLKQGKLNRYFCNASRLIHSLAELESSGCEFPQSIINWTAKSDEIPKT